MGDPAPADSLRSRAGYGYRPDIDGLRAAAVVAVILYHLHAVPLTGAFVGVDIFFVISGYLIGDHVIAAVEAGRFSLGGFYLRRARRILPALVVMLTVVTGLACWLLYPDALASYGGSLAAAALSVANIWFYATTDYFAPPAQAAPLLHTWSLAVEEQYYLLFPAFVLLLHRLVPQRLASAVYAATALLLGVAALQVTRDSTLAFYGPHARMWELLLGTAILFPRLGWLGRRWLREAVVAAGAVAMVASMRLLTDSTPFPGPAALPVCLGAAAVIAAGAHGPTLGGRLLSLRPVRAIGLISYSLYLWHWPLILLWKAARPVTDLSTPEKAGLALATLVVGALSWRFVEQPLRRARWSPRATPAAAGTAILALAAVGGALAASDGWPGRFPPAELALVRYEHDHSPPRDPVCFLASASDLGRFDPDRCLDRDPRRPNVLLFGDSHANHLWHGLSRFGGANMLELAIGGCRPLIGLAAHGKRACRAPLALGFDWIAHNRPDLVLLAGRWNAADLPDLEATLGWFRTRGIAVALAGPVAEYDASLPQLLARAQRSGDPALPARHRVPGIERLDRRMAALAARSGIHYLSPYRALCPAGGGCVVVTPAGAPVQHDYGHLTAEGSDWVASRLLGGRPLVDRAPQ